MTLTGTPPTAAVVTAVTPAVETVRPPAQRGRGRSRAGLAVAALALAAALFAGPLLVWWGWSGRHSIGRRLDEAGWVALGALPPLAAMVTYFRLATGSFLRRPFTFVGPGDTLGFSLFVVVRAFAEHRQYAAVRDRLYAAPRAAAAELDRAVVFLPPLDGPYLLQPFSLARNATFDGPVVWALDRGARRNLDVVQRFPGRTPYRVLLGDRDRYPTRLQRLEVMNGRLVAAGR